MICLLSLLHWNFFCLGNVFISEFFYKWFVKWFSKFVNINIYLSNHCHIWQNYRLSQFTTHKYRLFYIFLFFLSYSILTVAQQDTFFYVWLYAKLFEWFRLISPNDDLASVEYIRIHSDPQGKRNIHTAFPTIFWPFFFLKLNKTDTFWHDFMIIPSTVSINDEVKYG